MIAEERIVVNGRATGRAVPDRAAWRVRVSARDGDGPRAFAACTAKAQGLVDAVEAADFAAVTTTGHVSLRREYGDHPGKPAKEVAECEITVEVAVADAATVPDVVLAAGATELGGPRTWASEGASAVGALLEGAVEDARRKAGRIAAAAGRELGPIVGVEESGSGWDDDTIAYAATAAAGIGDDEEPVSIPVLPAGRDVTVRLRVAFALVG